VESALVTRLLVSAIDGNATPDMDYDIEIYEDESMTTKAYIARGITDVEYEDKIPWEWFGGTTMYIKVINNKAADITDLDITINYRR
jgi:predicted nucleotidyltransferase